MWIKTQEFFSFSKRTKCLWHQGGSGMIWRAANNNAAWHLNLPTKKKNNQQQESVWSIFSRRVSLQAAAAAAAPPAAAAAAVNKCCHLLQVAAGV